MHCWLERNKYIISLFDIAVRVSACLLCVRVCVCVRAYLRACVCVEDVWVGAVAAARLKCTAASSRFCLSASCSLTPAHHSLSLSFHYSPFRVSVHPFVPAQNLSVFLSPVIWKFQHIDRHLQPLQILPGPVRLQSIIVKLNVQDGCSNERILHGQGRSGGRRWEN